MLHKPDPRHILTHAADVAICLVLAHQLFLVLQFFLCDSVRHVGSYTSVFNIARHRDAALVKSVHIVSESRTDHTDDCCPPTTRPLLPAEGRRDESCERTSTKPCHKTNFELHCLPSSARSPDLPLVPLRTLTAAPPLVSSRQY